MDKPDRNQGHAGSQEPGDETLTARAAAARLGVNERTIRRAVARGELAAIKFAGVFRIAQTDLERYRRHITNRPTPAPADSHLLRLVPPARPALPALPRPMTSFVGREAVVATAAEMLCRPDVRLLTLTGPGGVGKTRVAIAAAEHLRENFDDGVGFVPLAAVREPEMVMPTLAQHLGLREGDRGPVTHRIQAFLGEHHALLVLDNFEQVVAAAPAVSDLLTACPRLRLLVTSRAPLRISGEQALPIPPLSLPPPGSGAEVFDSEAVYLFLARAQAIRPDVAATEATRPAIAAICQRLDGLPLAIELAAARASVLTPPAMLARLDQRLPLLTGGARDHPARLQTMRNAIAWSYDLLDPAEQRLFRRLAVFAGGFTLEAADAVGRSEERAARNEESVPPVSLLAPRFSLLDLLASLVDKSLLQQTPGPDGEPRFAMLETIREYGLEQLEGSGEATDVQAAHADYFLALAEQGERAFADAASGDWLKALTPEIDNIRAAHSWFAEQGAIEAALRLVVAAIPLWRIVGDTAGASRALTTYLERGDDVAPVARTKALILTATFEAAGGDCPRGMALADEAAAIARRHGDALSEAQALTTLGMISFFLGRADDGFRYTEDAISRYRVLDDRHALGHALCQLAMGGTLGAFEGSGGPIVLARTVAATEEALSLFRELDQPTDIARAHCGLGYLAFTQRNYPRAARQLHESIAHFWQVHDLWGLAAPLEHLAAVAAMTGHPEPAARLHGAIDALRETIGRPVPPAFQPERERERSISRVTLGEDAFADALTAGHALPLEDAVAEALAIAGTIAEGGKNRSSSSPPSALTPREIDVLQLVAAGHTNRQIAAELFLSPATVKRHVTHILAKLDLPTRAAASSYAVRAGLIDVDPSAS